MSISQTRVPSPKGEEKSTSVQLNVLARVPSSRDEERSPVEYRLYKKRFTGALGLWVLSFAAGMTWPFFGPIANSMSDTFDISLDRVNWLGNIPSCIYLIVAPTSPIVIQKWGLRRTCEIGSIALLISAWVRYSGTAKSLSPNAAYGLLILGQFFAAIAQPIFQLLAPKYSENWFNLQGRTSATMALAIANPIGSAIGQLISPMFDNPRQAIFALGIISSAAAPFVFLIESRPPTPPTLAGSRPSPSIYSLISSLLGVRRKDQHEEATISTRERLDFLLLFLIFGYGVAIVNTWSILSAQILAPHGYSDTISGLMGATLLLAGIVAAIVTAPLLDRVFTDKLAVTAKILVPIMGVGWFSLIWAVKPNNDAGLFVIMAITGICAVTLLPVAQELAVEVTRNAEGSSALLWTSGNMFTIALVLAEQALRASPEASPPLHMKRALILSGVISLVLNVSILGLRGEQKRRRGDEGRQPTA